MGYLWPIPEDPLPVARRKPHPKESVWPWSPNYEPPAPPERTHEPEVALSPWNVPFAPIVASDEAEETVRAKVTRANFREVARGFDEEQLQRLAALMRRHDKETCEECQTLDGVRGRGRRFSCNFAVEAVEVVALGVEARHEAPDYYPATDWNQNSYAAFGAPLRGANVGD